MFISLSSTCIQNFSNWYALFVAVVFFITYCSRCSMKWHCVLTHRWSILSFFITCCAEASSAPKQYLFSLGSGKKNILGIHPKMIINPAPFHSKAFVLLYKFETSWALLSRLSRVFFFAISGASNFSNFKHFKQLFKILSRLCLPTMWELPRRVSCFVSSVLKNYFSCFIQEVHKSNIRVKR